MRLSCNADADEKPGFFFFYFALVGSVSLYKEKEV